MMEQKIIPLESLLVTLPTTLHDALEAINSNTLGIVFLVDDDRKLVGVFTDGDARRTLLSGVTLEDPITYESDHFNSSPHFLPFNCEISDIWNLQTRPTLWAGISRFRIHRCTVSWLTPRCTAISSSDNSS